MYKYVYLGKWIAGRAGRVSMRATLCIYSATFARFSCARGARGAFQCVPRFVFIVRPSRGFPARGARGARFNACHALYL
jgi:hypothetical protein